MHHLLRSESARRYSLAVTASVAVAPARDAVAEVRTGHRALDSFSSARSIALSSACRHVECSGGSRVQFRSLLSRAPQSIGIAEAPRLNFFDRCIYRRSLRAAFVEVPGVDQLRTRPPHRQL